MQNFQPWFALLISDERFYENASRNHRKETVEETARKVYEVETLKPEIFKVKPIEDHRMHLLNKLYKVPADKIKKPWYEIQLEEKEKEKKASEPEWVPVTGDRRERWLKVWQWRLNKITAPQRIRPMKAKEIMEQGQWDKPLPKEFIPSAMDQRIQAFEHYQRAQEARAKLFISAYPDASPEEVQAYLLKFEEIDNPLGL